MQHCKNAPVLNAYIRLNLLDLGYRAQFYYSLQLANIFNLNYKLDANSLILNRLLKWHYFLECVNASTLKLLFLEVGRLVSTSCSSLLNQLLNLVSLYSYQKPGSEREILGKEKIISGFIVRSPVATAVLIMFLKLPKLHALIEPVLHLAAWVDIYFYCFRITTR